MNGVGKKVRYTSREITVIAMAVALLLGGQLALSQIQGVEIVTPVLACFAFSFGARRGMVAATAFSLLRCIIFGFFAYVIALYLIYFNLLACLFGLIGAFKRKGKGTNAFFCAVCVIVAVVMTVLFTLFDCVLSALFYSTPSEYVNYFTARLAASVIVLSVQPACAAVSVTLLFYPLTSIFSRVGLQLGLGGVRSVPVESV